ncbi:hypothetical protein ABIE30_000651 [Janthinobacterium lividum]|uniref:hypothetical protein n=1 Tax=Janthinobacterium lividum TaxID=29581 RepID=UPI003D1F15DA
MNDQTTLSTSPLEEQALAWPEKAIPEKWVKALFNKMAFSYGVKFADQWKGIDPDGIKRHWAQKLFVLTTAELTRGVERLDTRAWPPTLPEFLALCRPPIDPSVAFHEALEQGALRDRGEPNVWSSPAVFWAWRKLGAFDCAHSTYAMLRPRWEAALAAELEREVIEPVPAQDPVALPAPGKTMMSSRKAQQLIGAFKLKNLGDAGHGDGRRWARRIIERKKAGMEFSIFVIECAERELGMRA